jgi:DNA uptake protein ComE-like DNA-binding protein
MDFKTMLKWLQKLPILVFAGIVVLAQAQTPYSSGKRLDLNNASLEEIRLLPITEAQADALYDRVTYKGPFSDIYEIRQLAEIDRDTWLRIRPLIWLEPFEERSDRERRIESIYYQLERWEGAEGITTALVDTWVDKAMDPANINEMRLDEMVNMQNLSLPDAVAILEYRREAGRIASQRNMRSIPGLSYYGYRNLRNFIRYDADDREADEVHGQYMLRLQNTPFYGSQAESGEETVNTLFTDFSNNTPGLYTKIRLSVGKHGKFGMAYDRHRGEADDYVNSPGYRNWFPRAKFYFGVENLTYGDVSLRKLYVGNYLLAFGQGVVMETIDDFTPRKNGMSFRKRLIGITGDATQNRQWGMYGAAAEFAYGDLVSLTGFISKNRRDAILGQQTVRVDSVDYHPINQFIVLNQRISDLAGQRYQIDGLDWVQSAEEVTFGGHVAIDVPWRTGTQIGATYYESLYDRPLQPSVEDLVAAGNEGRISPVDDAEMHTAYGGDIALGTSGLWSKAVAFRRVYGFDFRTVYNNVSFEMEYGELDKARGLFNNPGALVAQFYSQWESLNFFVLYRNYHLEYDNPYQRSFSNYQRYKGSILEDYFYLDSEAFGQLYSNAYQPQAENGLYFRTRYQFARSWLATVEYDRFTRKTDDAKYYRWVATLQYSPVFPVRINLRYKDQARERDNDVTPNKFFRSNEFRVRTTLRLSGYDQLGMIYAYSNVDLSPRPRLSYPAEDGDPRYPDESGFSKVTGNVGLPGYALGGFWTHNFNQNFKFTGSLLYYNGFFWGFEDNQFTVLDSPNGSFRYWASFFVRVNQHLTTRLRYTVDRETPVPGIHGRDYQTNSHGDGPDQNRWSEYSRGYEHTFYLEMNYYF